MNNEYINTAGKRSFIYADLVDGTNIAKYNQDATTQAVSDNAAYNVNYHKRMNLTRSTLDVIIPLNNMEFFQSMRDILIPPTKVEITIDIESDDILIYKDSGVDDGKVTIKDIFLCYEKLTLSTADKLLCTKFLSSSQTINFYRESINTQTLLKHREKNIILYETASKPRELFVWFSYTENRSSQDNNSFNIDTNNLKIINASVVINDNRHIPITPFNCVIRGIEAYNELLKYMTEKNKRESTFIDYELFKSKYMTLYFDIKNNLSDVLRNSYCKIKLKYILKDKQANDYSVY